MGCWAPLRVCSWLSQHGSSLGKLGLAGPPPARQTSGDKPQPLWRTPVTLRELSVIISPHAHSQPCCRGTVIQARVCPFQGEGEAVPRIQAPLSASYSPGRLTLPDTPGSAGAPLSSALANVSPGFPAGVRHEEDTQTPLDSGGGFVWFSHCFRVTCVGCWSVLQGLATERSSSPTAAALGT